jgi:hypothetical protein
MAMVPWRFLPALKAPRRTNHGSPQAEDLPWQSLVRRGCQGRSFACGEAWVSWCRCCGVQTAVGQVPSADCQMGNLGVAATGSRQGCPAAAAGAGARGNREPVRRGERQLRAGVQGTRGNREPGCRGHQPAGLLALRSCVLPSSTLYHRLGPLAMPTGKQARCRAANRCASSRAPCRGNPRLVARAKDRL